MSLLRRVKSLLGLSSTEESPEPDTASERAVKEATTVDVTEPEPSTPSDIGGSSETVEQAQEATVDQTEAEVEPSEEAASVNDSAEQPADEPEEAPEDAEETTRSEEEDQTAEVPGHPSGPSTVEIKGIGDTYAERLASAGIETVGDLAEADIDSLASSVDISRGRLETWIERAQAYETEA